MTRLTAYLALEQGRTAAVWCGAIWIATTALGIIGAIVAGHDRALWSTPTSLAALAVATLPTALRIGLPFAVAQCALRLVEDGERDALRLIGVSPVRACSCVLLPLVPALAALHVGVHDARPAALRALAAQAAGSLDAVLSGDLPLASERVGLVRHGEGARLLAAVGDGAVAVELARAPAPGADGIGAGRFRSLRGGTGSFEGRFAGIALALPAARRRLADHDESELSSAFLAGRGLVWSRARAVIGDFDGDRRVARELARRRAALPAALLGIAIGLLPFWMRRRLGAGAHYLAIGLPAIVASLLLPRLLG